MRTLAHYTAGVPLIVEQATHFDRVARLALLVELVERALHEERELLGAHAVNALLDRRRVQRSVLHISTNQLRALT